MSVASVTLTWRLARWAVPLLMLGGLALVAPLAGGDDQPDPTGADTAAAAAGIGPVLAAAYTRAPVAVLALVPDCRVRWQVLAAVGKVESGHATAGGSTIAADGTVNPPILGPLLDGHLPNTQIITDTDHGTLDANSAFDRAVGPAQFLPATWAGAGADGNGDGRADPQNVFDAELAKARYLCLAVPGHDLTGDPAILTALWAYNRSHPYGTEVLGWVHTYDQLSLTGPPAAGAAEGTVDGYALPLPRAVFDADPARLSAPHHDYPASDLMVAEATPVYAARAGIVARVVNWPHNWWTQGCSQSAVGGCATCGVGVSVNGDDGVRYTYCHGTAALVSVGASRAGRPADHALR